jgi:hypothetical protein
MSETTAIRIAFELLKKLETERFVKNCQAFVEKTKVIAQHSTPLPPLYPQRVLAGLGAGLGILIIGGKKKKQSFCSAILRVETSSAGFVPAGLFYWAQRNFSVAREVTRIPLSGTKEGNT